MFREGNRGAEDMSYNNASDSDNIDSDTEDKILSHLYYQSSEQANATPVASNRNTPAPSSFSLNGSSVIHNVTTKRHAPVAKEAMVLNETDQDEDSKYSSIESKRRRTAGIFSIAGIVDASSDSQDMGERAIPVAVIRPFRSSTATDEDSDMGESEVASADHASKKANGAGKITYNASDDDAVNDYLDSVATSGQMTPVKAASYTLSSDSFAGSEMKQQQIQIDSLMTPTARPSGANTGPSKMLTHSISMQKPHDAEENEYDYLDDAEIQGHNRYFMEEKETLCFKCHQSGHIAKDCTTTTCLTCGQNGHTTRECKLSGSVCHRCNMRGHMSSECPQQSGRRSHGHSSGCNRCHSRNHHTEECSTIWRKYVYSGNGSRSISYQEVSPWCYNCANPGHFGDDCPDEYSRWTSSYSSNTAFGSNNCPGKIPYSDPNSRRYSDNKHSSAYDQRTPANKRPSSRHSASDSKAYRRSRDDYTPRGQRTDYRNNRGSRSDRRGRDKYNDGFERNSNYTPSIKRKRHFSDSGKKPRSGGSYKKWSS
ncbi:hypothetical protein H4R99_006394 [Coemansia sp. RSA 1722]|nr:hypothetical protein IWW45_006064 [Coemansia sp. RSA 485]KAJ2592473.1 hypothetical protein H4R99_006394 [Coemansia sp. RSA 1722]